MIVSFAKTGHATIMSRDAKRAELFRGHQSGSPFLDNRMEMLLAENQSIQNSTSAIDQTLEVGIATRERMLQQEAILAKSNSQLGRMIAQVPVVGQLASKIQVKRKRDRLILGGLIGFLMFFCVWYLFG